MARLSKSEDVPRTTPWLNSYADLVTLLWTFFILLFSLSVVNAPKFEAGMGSIQGAFGVSGGGTGIFEGGSTTPELSRIAQELAKMEMLGLKFQEEIDQAGLTDKVSVEMDPRGLIFRFADSALFDLGSADLKPDAIAALEKVGKLIATAEAAELGVRIEGHTDDWPISTERFPSNWELSTGRAASVVRFFIDNLGFSPLRLEAAGYGQERPIASNATQEGRQRNRRVDVVLLRPSLAEAEPGASLEETETPDYDNSAPR